MNNILYAANMNYFKYMITSIYSLVENNKGIPLTIHIIEDGFTDEQKYMLNGLLEQYNIQYRLYKVDIVRDYLDNFKIPLWRGTEVANARLFASEIVQDTDKVLYLDSDTIITNSIKEIFKMKMDFPVSAVRELEVSSYLPQDINKYYNSGVLLFNLTKWEEESCTDKLYRELSLYRDILKFPDQDLLNLALHDSIGDLPFNYNITPNIIEVLKHPYLSRKAYKDLDDKMYDKIIDDLEKPCIYHMIKYITIRPWEKNNIHPFNDLFNEYFIKMYPEYNKEKTNFVLGNFPLLPEINLIRKSIVSKKGKETSTNVMKKVLNRNEL